MSETRTSTIAAFVGATGGAGTTRTVIEVAAALAADGRDVAVFDAAFATQGLAEYVSGRIDPDLTALVTDTADSGLSAGLIDLDLPQAVPGRVAVCPVYAPFERIARAKRVDAAQLFESRIRTAASRFDCVLLDVPPLAANQSVAAVTVAGRIAVVAPGTDRGAAAIPRTTERLADVGTEAALAVSTRGDLDTADVSIPSTDVVDARSAPSCLDGDSSFAAAIERVASAVTGQAIDTSDDRERGIFDTVGDYVSRKSDR